MSLFRKNKPITIVSGLPRSGTSMMMKMLESGGIPPLTDHERTADDDNPKGYYEFERVKALREGDTAWLPKAQGKVVKVVVALLEFLPPPHQYRVIVMRRAMPEILASQSKMLSNRREEKGVDEEQLGLMMQSHLTKTVQWARRQQNMQVIEIDYNMLLEDAMPQLRVLNTVFQNKLDIEAMAAQIDPALYRQKTK